MPQEPNLSTPEATVRSFVAALTKPDLKLAARHVKDIKPSAALKGWEDFMRDAKLVAKVLEVKISEGPDGSVIATCKLSVKPGGNEASTETSSIALQRVGEAWLLVRPNLADPEAKVSFLKMSVAMLSAPKSELDIANRYRYRNLCMKNLKQVVVAAYMFLVDNDDVFKLNGENAAKKLKPYLKDAKFLACPSHGGKGPSYTFNQALAGKPYTAIDEPEKTVLFYEGSDGKLDFSRHRGTANLAFCDTSVRAIQPGEEKSLRWNP